MTTALKPDALRTHMARRGWSQVDLAKHSDLSDSTISLALQGKPIGEPSIKKILDALTANPPHPLAEELINEGAAAS